MPTAIFFSFSAFVSQFEKKSNGDANTEPKKRPPPPQQPKKEPEIEENVLGTIDEWNDERGRGVVRRIGYDHTAVLLMREVQDKTKPEVGDIYLYDIEERRDEMFAINAERRERAPASRERDGDDRQQRDDDDAPPPPAETTKKQQCLKDVAGAMFDMMMERK
eukprot:gene13698-39251_t